MNPENLAIESRMRECRVPDDLITRVMNRLATVSAMESEVAVLRIRVQDLEQLVPPGVIRTGPPRTMPNHRSKWD